ncbi:MAG: T9SS type A sorting domain-containing protein [Candidatus Cloacimonetes bacterium]|nr:T9SS type A sorting domain-containing protein [Candidatus Cloacimonadota bacterium]
MRFKHCVVLVLLLGFIFGLLQANIEDRQGTPVKGQLLPAPFATFTPQREGTLISSTLIFEEDFDPAPSNWNIVDGWNIGQSPGSGSISGVNSAYTTTPYASNALYQLVSPLITLPEATGTGIRYELNLWHWWAVESNADYVYIDVLVDGQIDTSLLTQTGEIAWTQNTLDLSFYAGQTIQLQFRLVSDGSYEYSGFGVDDIQIWQREYQFTPEMNLLSLNAQNFPFIYSTVSVALEGEDMSNLDENNFQVYENDVLQSNFYSVIPPSSGAGSRLVDIVFQMDNSGSMGSSINAVSQNVTNFINDLAGSGVDSALGLCRYGQSSNNGLPYLEDNGLLTTNLNYFRDDVWSRNYASGGNEPGYYAITQSLNGFNWRPGSQKVLVIITDEHPDQGYSTLQNAIDACTANGAILFALTYSNLYYSFTPITEATGGAVYDINSSFDAILAQISDIIVSNYIISYRSNNPYYDGVLRNMRIVMNYGNVTAEVLGSYFPGQAPQIFRTQNTAQMDNQAQLDNQPITIDATISDTYAPFTSSATLYYRNFNQSSYTALAMQNVGGDLWSATIPADQVQTPGIAYYYSATDGQSTSTLPTAEPTNNPFTIAVLPNQPPLVQHSPQLQTNFYSPLNISANIFDDTNYVEGATLAYRRYGTLSYTFVDMQALDVNQYYAQIPGEIVGNSGVEYFIRAWDNYGLVGASGFADNPHYVAAMLDGTVIPGGEITDLWWNAAQSPYYISSDVYVNPNNLLHIEPGSTLIFAPGTGLEILGGLNASGANFAAQNNYMGWNGILINNAPGPITIQNCSINHAVVGITFQNANGDVVGTTISKEAENNTFAGEAGISIQGHSSPNLTDVNIQNYNPGILIQNTSGAPCSPTLQFVYMQQGHTPERELGNGMEVEGNVNLSLDDIEIVGFDQGIYWIGSQAADLRNSALLSNIRIRNSSSTSRLGSKAMHLQDIASLELNEVILEGYQKGIEIDNPNLAHTGTTLLSNIRVRNSASTSRSGDFGVKIDNSMGVEIDDIEIDDYDLALEVNGAPNTDLRSTVLLSNIRVRNSSSTSRIGSKAVRLQDISSVQLNTAILEGCQSGIEIDNPNLVNTGNTLLSNIRIRNSASTSRSGAYGIKIDNNMGVELDDIIIDEYEVALEVNGDPNADLRSTVLLSNIRVRNSSSTSRSQDHGVRLNNLGMINAQNIMLDDFSYGLEIDNLAMTNPANVSLSNIRAQCDSTDFTSIALKLVGPVAATINDADLREYGTGIYYEGNGLPFDRTTPLLSNIRIRNSASTSREESKGIVLKNLAAIDLDKCIIYPDLRDQRAENSAGAGVICDGVNNASISQSSIWGFENGLRLHNNSNANFERSVIWRNTTTELANPIVTDNSIITASNSVISVPGGVFPGEGNQDVDPLFANPLEGNFYLKPRSVLHNDDPALVIGALPFDFYALAEHHVQNFHAGWNLAGVPYYLEPGQDHPTEVFGDALAPFYVSPYYTSILQLNSAVMPDSLGHVALDLVPAYIIPDQIITGVGYWVRNPNPIGVDVDVSVYGVLDDGDFLMETPGEPLANEGWYMLSNPYDVPVSLNDGITFADPLITFVYLCDQQNHILQPIDLTAGSQIPAWSAFIFKANQPNDQVYFSYPVNTRASDDIQPLASNPEFVAASKPEWEIFLNAQTGDYHATITLGTARNASDTYDPMDVPEVPFSPFKALDLKINNQNWGEQSARYVRDIRSSRTTLPSWDLMLNVEDLLVDGRFSGSVCFSMDSPYRLPEGCAFRLQDIRTGININLLDESLVLTLDIDLNDPQGIADAHLIPLRLNVTGINPIAAEEVTVLSTSNYPNPFNPSTTISYSLPQDSHVNVEIFNIKGQLVRQLISAQQNAGNHSVIWNGKDSNDRECSSGFYFYRLTTDGQHINRKILMMK